MQEQNRKLLTGLGSEVFPSSCAEAFKLRTCAASVTHLASGQKIACEWCTVAAAEYEYRGCGVNKKEQHSTGLFAILIIKLVIWSSSEVPNAQISDEEDNRVTTEQMRLL